VRGLESIGVTYLRSGTRELEEAGPFFVIFEATGLSELAFGLTRHLGRNGILVLTGVPRGPQEGCLDLGRMMAGIVRTNQVILGSVNACRGCFVRGLERLDEIRRRFPAFARGIITRRVRPENFREAFERRDPGDIKVVIEWEG